MPEITSHWHIVWLVVLALLSPVAFILGRAKRHRGEGSSKQRWKERAIVSVIFLLLMVIAGLASADQKPTPLASAVRSGGWRLSGKEIALPQGPLCQTHAVITGRHVTLKVAGAHVFEATLARATRLCGAEFGVLNLDDGNILRMAAVYNVPPALAATQNVPFRVHPQSGQAEIRRTRQVVHIDDIRAMPPYLEGDPRLVALADLGGARTTLAVPMLKEDALLGSITIYRQEVRHSPTTQRQSPHPPVCFLA